MTNDDERAAREWLKHLQRPGATSATWADNAATILRMLDRPVLPRGDDVPDEVLGRMANAIFGRAHLNNGEAMRAAIDVLRAHLTAPPPIKNAWGVSRHNDWVVFDSKSAAQKYANDFPGSRVVKLVEAADE